MVLYQLKTGYFKWKVTYIYRNSEEFLEVWANNKEDAIEQAVQELARMDKLTDCTIQSIQKVDRLEDTL